MKRASRIFLKPLLLLAVSLAAPLYAADQFGDISVEPHAIYTGNTYHGYAETRVTLENRSTTKAHVVTLSEPNRSYNNGNSIGRLARSVKLEPGAREIVSLLQPPLPVQGDNQIHVDVDGRGEGEVHAPNANNHCNNYSRGGNEMATVFVSRSLDFDAVENLFHANRGAFTASKAVGPPDAGGGGYQPNAWMPDTRRYNTTNWLELDYAAPQTVNKVVVNRTSTSSGSGAVVLVSASGTNIARLSMSSGRTTSSSGTGWDIEYTLPTTTEPVKTVRLEFGKQPPHTIAVDAVQIAGPTGAQWASDARASSDNSASAPAYAPGSASGDSVESIRAESPISEWSENWLAYSPFDAVVLNAADLGAMTPAVLAALGDYLYAGGNIVIVDKATLPAAWHPSAQKKNSRGGGEYEIGFGRCFVLGWDNLSSQDTVATQKLREAVREESRYWSALPSDGGAANQILPVVENLKIPTRGIVVMMLVFIVIIGPVNIIYLNRRKRRTWMLWTIPAISLVTTLLVFVYSLLREGITPDTRIVGITVIDQVSHHAATTGATAFYCPLTPSGGLYFDFGTEATPLVEIGYGSGTSREVDWTQAQHFQRGWVSARVPVHFHIRKTETRRERIQIVAENGKPQVVNSLGAPIKGLWLADENGKIYQAYNIAAGQKAELTASTYSSLSEKSGAHGLLRDMGFASSLSALPLDSAKYLQPGTYLAILESNPFIENGLGSAARAKRTKSSSIVFGILEPSEAK